jgi:transposase
MAIDTVVQRSAGLDIAKASLVACVRIPAADGGWQVIKRKFTTMTADLLALRDWLAEHNIARVGMESTSDYWRPVFYLLEQRFDCWLLNARHMRAVPGRKTDMTDAEWICDLVALGLVRPSFVPPPPIRRLRDLTRRRAIPLAERTREKQRMEKLLEDAGAKLSVVATDIFGKSGRAMLDALIAGERDPKVLAELAMGRLRKKIPALAEALVGRFDDHHAFLANMICNHIDTIGRMIAELNTRIDTEIKPYRTEIELLDSLPGVDTRTDRPPAPASTARRARTGHVLAPEPPTTTSAATTSSTATTRPPAPPSHRPTRTPRLPGHPRTPRQPDQRRSRHFRVVIFESTRDNLRRTNTRICP